MAGPRRTPAPVPSLVPARDVEGDAPHFEALSGRPFLAIEPAALVPPSGWFRLRYRLSFFDRPVRPIISFRRGGAEIGWRLLPGPVLGRGEGLLTAPAGTTAVWISPVARAGRFSFVLEAIEPVPAADVLRRGWAGDRGRFFSALATFALGWRPEAELNFRWATQHTPWSQWPAYRDRLAAPPDWRELERPRCDWTAAPRVRLHARLDADTPPEVVETTLDSLRGQMFPHWSLQVAGADEKIAALAAEDARIGACGGQLLHGQDRDLAGFIGFGDRLAPHALACFIETMARDARASAAYCDEDLGPEPVFKPEWSRNLETARPYVGRLLLARLSLARARLASLPAFEEAAFAKEVLRGLTRHEVAHIPRPLIETRPRANPTRPSSPRPPTARAPHVTIIMPTRDCAPLLRQSVESLLAKTRYPAFDLVLVDNGSTEPAALEALRAAGRDKRVSRIDSPGAFNFSRLCNLGAAVATGEVLVFLNNDVEITEGDWLGELAFQARRPDVGAVGCLLLYPDGRIQHAGIVLGLGESAGHCDAGLAASAPGWLGRNDAVHEVSAVTGACLAVEQSKFAAVGGFDEIHLPIEFNDIDLCLRLEERGFQTLWTPLARLTHFESASRGKATFRRLGAHAAERAYMLDRWADRLRDDPCYHPGLSLFSLTPQLA
ncbi:glycosyltransferase family 2 protein [Methylocella silvestris]|uniref:Glycosyl transferase family 2 n=1 Tax=Methylocella silvestris TaxID=199596 RepID=A0A2J7TFV2_METSI|nr:glycosyltransferase family 2 protein [Methylocella silvestris]PNG25651.1 glycosyl transferase family 2 [Methylocella silvestris]